MAKKTVSFRIVTPEKIILEKDIFQITLPTQEGEITVLPDHIPLVSVIKAGIIELETSENEKEVISIAGGFLEVKKNQITILADKAERAAELDEERLIKAKARAEEAKAKALEDDHYDFSAVAARLEMELIREKALQKWRKIRSK